MFLKFLDDIKKKKNVIFCMNIINRIRYINFDTRFLISPVNSSTIQNMNSARRVLNNIKGLFIYLYLSLVRLNKKTTKIRLIKDLTLKCHKYEL